MGLCGCVGVRRGGPRGVLRHRVWTAGVGHCCMPSGNQHHRMARPPPPCAPPPPLLARAPPSHPPCSSVRVRTAPVPRLHTCPSWPCPAPTLPLPLPPPPCRTPPRCNAPCRPQGVLGLRGRPRVAALQPCGAAAAADGERPGGRGLCRPRARHARRAPGGDAGVNRQGHQLQRAGVCACSARAGGGGREEQGSALLLALSREGNLNNLALACTVPLLAR